MKYVMEYGKKIIVYVFCFIAVKVIKAQTILNENYLLETNLVQDSSTKFRYFHKIDAKFEQRVDSFINLIAQTKISNKKGKTDKNTDKGYISINFDLLDEKDYYLMRVSLENTYATYHLFVYPRYYENRNFGFTHYKGYLLLFEFQNQKFKMKSDLLPLISDLIYPVFTKEVQKEIGKNLDEVELISNGIIKGYKIKFND